MNYQKIYDDLIQSAKLRPDISFLNGYTEKHHILPRSMGGSDEESNLVKLTAREHYIAHWLLSKIYNNKEMNFAFFMMNIKDNKQKRYISSKGYEIAKKKLIEAIKGNTYNKGNVYSKEVRQKMSELKKGKPSPTKGKTFSKEVRKKISDSTRNLTDNDIETIKNMKKEGYTQTHIANKFKITQSMVSRILSGKRYSI